MDPMSRVYDKIANSLVILDGAIDKTPVMRYVGTAGFIPYGTIFSFQEFFDSRLPGEAMTVRDYLLLWIIGSIQVPDPGV